MTAHSNPQASAATALSQLLTEHPEVVGLTWSINTLGVLEGEQHAETGHGQVVDDCAQVLGGTAAHTVLSRAGDRLGLAQLTTTWRDVPVHVWASYPEAPIGGAL
ncbi:hypothetical protein [Streptomyces sp. A1136]|uniref:hypothetical protein n=1 Tax=Streptomyces sp. A1136 TaxID=2563102 RepID=UPI00109E5B83|nr:hypothetical protein [Streptomyces sp. A1136]THA50829.1 hypothetical protein E6R62_24075 [Streptomyces sp. A1136]